MPDRDAHRRHRRTPAGSALATVLVLVAAACSSEDGSSTSTTSVDDVTAIEASIDSEDVSSEFVLEPWSEELAIPTGLAFLPDGTALATEKGGFDGAATARVVHLDADGRELGTALEVPVCADAERGLLGIATDPEFEQNSFVYLYSTRQMADCFAGDIGEVPAEDQQVFNRLSRFTYADGRLDPASESVLIDGIPSFQSAHNGGGIAFAPDGMLLVGVGDSQLRETASDPTTFGGKILRIDPRTRQAPPDNPFVATSPEPPGSLVYATGLRNPFRFGVDPVSGQVVVADVGDVEYEELNLISPGADYGWPDSEGPDGETGEEPILWYTHGDEDNCGAVIGGPFARSSALGEDYEGAYVYGDFGCGRIWAAELTDGEVTGSRLLARSTLTLTDMTFGPDGLLYASSTGGIIHRLRPA